MTLIVRTGFTVIAAVVSLWGCNFLGGPDRELCDVDADCSIGTCLVGTDGSASFCVAQCGSDAECQASAVGVPSRCTTDEDCVRDGDGDHCVFGETTDLICITALAPGDAPCDEEAGLVDVVAVRGDDEQIHFCASAAVACVDNLCTGGSEGEA